jgi:hypothetical protein
MVTDQVLAPELAAFVEVEQSREVELATRLWQLENERAMLKEQDDVLKAEQESNEKALIDYLVDQGKASTGHIDGVGEFKLKKSIYPTVTKTQLPNFITYLKTETEDSGIIKETIEANTLKAYVRGKVEEMVVQLDEDATRREELRTLLGLAELASNNDIALGWFGRYGVSIFSDTKLSHTKKGK